METATMGQVRVPAVIQNVTEYLKVKSGSVAPANAPSINVPDALVDTGAKYLGLPSKYIRTLGLEHIQTRQALTAKGVSPCQMYSPVWLTINGRECAAEVIKLPDECRVLVGFLALESLDFVIDPVNQCLIGNPRHGGENIVDMF